jgi:hypothetical protein
VGIGITSIATFGSEMPFFFILGVIIIISGLLFPFANRLTGKHTFEYKRKKPQSEREYRREEIFGDKYVEAYDKDALAYSVKYKYNY